MVELILKVNVFFSLVVDIFVDYEFKYGMFDDVFIFVDMEYKLLF